MIYSLISQHYIPTLSLICHICGKYDHPEVGCDNEEMWEQKARRQPWPSVQTLRWWDTAACQGSACGGKLKEICQMKVDRDVYFAHARHIHKQEHKTPSFQSYANMVCSQGEGTSRETRKTASLRGRVESVESKLDKVNWTIWEAAPTAAFQRDNRDQWANERKPECNGDYYSNRD